MLVALLREVSAWELGERSCLHPRLFQPGQNSHVKLPLFGRCLPHLSENVSVYSITLNALLDQCEICLITTGQMTWTIALEFKTKSMLAFGFLGGTFKVLCWR